MFRALLYLRLMSAKNWLLSRSRRLRQPKYLLSALVGFGYFYFFFFRSLDVATAQSQFAPLPPGTPIPDDILPLTLAIGAAGLLVFFACLWVIPTERASLGFSEAEIAFLFPAPVSRRSLVHFRLLSVQFRALFGATLMTLFTNRWTFLGGNAATHAIGWWIIFSTLNLHLAGARFTLTRMQDLGVGVWRRRLLILVALAAVVSATWIRQADTLHPALPDDASMSQLLRAFVLPWTDVAPLAWILWPLQRIVAPFLAPDLSDFLFALVPALILVAAHYLWVVRSALAFEDASIEQAEKRAKRVTAWRSGGARLSPAALKPRDPPFRLAPIGRPEFAFLWKNLLSTWPYFTRAVFLISAFTIIALGVWLNRQPGFQPLLSGFGVMAVAFGAYTLIVGPQFARQDLRSDLQHADILKTYPLAGWQIVLGQLLTPVAILTGVLWLTLLAAIMLFLPDTARLAWLTPVVGITAVLGIAVVLPLIAAVQLLIPNTAALVFPAWFEATRGRGGGPEVIGQRLIFFFAQVITMLLALAPAAAFAAAVFFIVQWLASAAIALILSTVVMISLLGLEIAAGVWVLGRRFEALDPAADLRP